MNPTTEPVTTAQPTAPNIQACPINECRWHRLSNVVPWVAQVIVAVILAQTLYFKFTYPPETQYIFESRGGRPAATLIGLAELAAAVMLLIPRRASTGAALALAVIGGAIFTHLTYLGIEVKDPTTGESDGGLLFALAVTVALGSFVVLWYRWKELPLVGRLGERLGRGRAVV